jgi:hypothetical protein
VRVALAGGAYAARSVAAGAQRCINLLVERVPESADEPAPAAHYPTPGLQLFTSLGPDGAGGFRGLYRATRSTLYAVVGNGLYAIFESTPALQLGTLGTSTGTREHVRQRRQPVRGGRDGCRLHGAAGR